MTEDSEHSVQSPTISSIDSNSTIPGGGSSTASDPTQLEATHEKMKKDLQEALQKIIKLEELLKQKDERFELKKILEIIIRYSGKNRN